MKSKKLKIPIYDFVYKIYQGDISKLEKKYGITNTSDCTAFVHFTDLKKYDFIVAFRNDVKLSTIVHKSVHVVNIVYDRLGIEPDSRNDENQAYFTEYIFKQINNSIIKFNQRTTKKKKATDKKKKK